jgi:hypothetical protein
MASLPERMVGAMRGDARTFQEIEGDPNALGQAVTVIVIAAIASLIGNIFRGGITGGVLGLVLSLIGYAVWTVMIVLIGTKLLPEPTTKADFVEGFRVIGFTAAPGVFSVLAIIPFLGVLLQLLISIWMLVIGVIAVREVLDYSNTGRAILVCVIAFFIYMVIYVTMYVLVMVPLMLAGGAFG